MARSISRTEYATAMRGRIDGALWGSTLATAALLGGLLFGGRAWKWLSDDVPPPRQDGMVQLIACVNGVTQPSRVRPALP